MSIKLNFTDDEGKIIKTYTAVGIKTELVDKVFDVKVKEEEAVSWRDMKPVYDDMKAVLVEIYKNQFTVDDINKNTIIEEIKRCFSEWVTEILKNYQGEKSSKQPKT